LSWFINNNNTFTFSTFGDFTKEKAICSQARTTSTPVSGQTLRALRGYVKQAARTMPVG
jgi:hypothetical protein